MPSLGEWIKTLVIVAVGVMCWLAGFAHAKRCEMWADLARGCMAVSTAQHERIETMLKDFKEVE